MIEIWIELFTDYLVSNLGNVDSLKGGVRHRLKPGTTKNGYLQVWLTIDGKPTPFYVHRLVAMAFLPNPENKPQINHKNGIKMDNRVENLEWVTDLENKRHAVRTGLKKTKLTAAQVFYIRENPDDLGVYELAEKFDVNHTMISQIQTGKRWEHVGGVMRQAQKQSYSPRVPDDIREEIIRRYETDGISQRALAKEFGYSQPTISKIVNEK